MPLSCQLDIMSFTKEEEEGLFARKKEKKQNTAQAQLSKYKHKLKSKSYLIFNNLNLERRSQVISADNTVFKGPWCAHFLACWEGGYITLLI